MKKFKIGLLIGLFVVLACIGSIFAQKANANSLGLSLSPSIIEIHALPPSAVTSALSIQNKGNDPVQLQILLKPFKARLENAETEFLNTPNSFVTRNVQILDGGIPVEDLILGPRQQKNLTLNINITQDTNISDYYFSIVFASQNATGSALAGISNQLGIASNVLLSVGAKEMPDIIIEEFSSRPFYESGPVPFTVRIKNKGAHFIKPSGEILIKNMFGQSIGKLDLAEVNILSQSTRSIPNTLWNENFLLGFYTATLNVAGFDEGPGFSRSIHFFAFPFQGIIMIIIALISAIIIASKVRARMKR